LLWRSRVKLMKEVGRELTIDPDTGAKLLAVAKQPMKDVLMMIQDTGMRPEEVVRIRIENIDWRRRLIFNPNGKTKAAVWSNRKLGDGDECHGPLGCAHSQADQHRYWIRSGTPSTEGIYVTNHVTTN
jgi:hypothetical protein